MTLAAKEIHCNLCGQWHLNFLDGCPNVNPQMVKHPSECDEDIKYLVGEYLINIKELENLQVGVIRVMAEKICVMIQNERDGKK